MRNKHTVSIGIPAYNEEANIKYLLEALLLQKQKDFLLKEIIVYSDGSTDGTVELAKSIKSGKIRIFSRKKRLGKTHRLNEILKLYVGDILVLLDADILPADDMFLNQLVLPIIEGQADLVSGKAIPLPATTLIEHIINTGVDFKYSFLESARTRKYVYLCFGRARAFSRRISKNLIWPETIAEDSFSYFYCIFNGFKFLYKPKAKVFYRSPLSIADHIKQSARFIQSKKIMSNYFDQRLVVKSYDLNKLIILKSLVLYLIKKPFTLIPYIIIYLFVNTLLRFNINANPNSNIKWSMSTTSKKLV